MKKLLILISFVQIAFLFSCESQFITPFDLYVLQEGKHSSNLNIESLQASYLRFSAVFDQTAKYSTAIVENQHDINKLMGFSDCNSHHHDNSARFGWRWLEERLEIHAYVYANGERITQLIGQITLDQEYFYELKISDKFYHFFLEGFDPIQIKRNKKCDKGIYYMLYPYFGGDEAAPHDISIQIKRIF